MIASGVGGFADGAHRGRGGTLRGFRGDLPVAPEETFHPRGLETFSRAERPLTEGPRSSEHRRSIGERPSRRPRPRDVVARGATRQPMPRLSPSSVPERSSSLEPMKPVHTPLSRVYTNVATIK